MKRPLTLPVLIGFILLLTAACSSNAETPVGDASKGQQLFNSGGNSGIPCTTCHTLDGSTLVGPSLKGVGTRAAERIEGFSAEDYLRQSILSPSSYVVDGFPDAMNKTYPDTLSEADIDNLIAFLLTQ